MADVTFSGASIVLVTALLTALTATIAALFRLLMASKDAALNDMTSQRDSYQKMAAQSIAALELAANRARRARGEGPFQPIPAVVPEHNSPTTPAQLDTAEFQTLLARASRAGRILGITIDQLSDEPIAPVVDLTAATEDDEQSPVMQAIVLQAGETAVITAAVKPDDGI